jgi:restriction system protein
MDKRRQLRALATKRRGAKWAGYKGIGDYHEGAYECPYVSPHTKTAGNVDADIMVILQDWTSDESIRRGLDSDSVTYGYTRGLHTNRNLVRLLDAYFGASLIDVYGTNLFPFIKMGHMGTSIPRRDLVRAAREFALPQIRIVRPKLVICLGLATFNALREACDHEPIYPLAAAIRSPFSLGRARMWCQAHTGARVQNNRNSGAKRVPNDWTRMKDDVSAKA